MLALFLALTLAAQPSPAVDTKATSAEAAQDARFAAILKADTAYLESALDDSLTYQHSTGVAETKAVFIGAIRDHLLQYKAIDLIERKTRRFGSIAIITGVIRLQVLRGGETVDTKARFTDIYEWRSGRFIQVAWQNTRIPAE